MTPETSESSEVTRILWLSRHAPMPEQVAELERCLGRVEIVPVGETVSSAERVGELLDAHRCTELVAVLPVDLLAEVCAIRPGLRPIRAVMERRVEPDGSTSYRHRSFERITRLVLERESLGRKDRLRRRLLLTALGRPRNYAEGQYCFESRPPTRTLFSGIAAARLFRDEVGEILAVATPESENETLPRFLDEAKASGFPVAVAHVPSQITAPDDVWNVVKELESHIPPGCDLVLDITTGLRYVPFLAAALSIYLTIVWDVRIRRLVYAQPCDATGTPTQGDDRRPSGASAYKFVDVTGFVRMVEWAIAADQLQRTGSASALVEVAKAAGFRLEQVGRLTESIATARVPDLGGRAREALVELREVASPTSGVIPPLEGILRLINPGIEGLNRAADKTEFHLGLEAVGWCLRYGLIQQGLTILRETLVTYACLLAGVPTSGRARRTAENQMGDWANYQGPKRVSPAAAASRDEGGTATDGPQNDSNEWDCVRMRAPELPRLWRQVKDARDDVNHAGFAKSGNRAASELSRVLEEAYQAARKLPDPTPDETLRR